MFTVLAFLGCLFLLELGIYIFLLIHRELRLRREEEEFKRAEAVDSIPPSYLSNIEEYENLVQGEV
jgi:hypothetical protein